MDKYIKLSDAITTLHQIENLYRQTMVSSVRADVTVHCCKAVQAIPAADVVEVVRCRECIEFVKYRSAKGGLCKNTGCCVSEGFYCADGERKMDGGVNYGKADK